MNEKNSEPGQPLPKSVPPATKTGSEVAAVKAMVAAVRNWRLTIRFKVLILLTLFASAVSAVVATTLISFFNEDKVTYIQDLNADIAGNTAG